jgi:tRNA (cmo5U34)-methyltransferase
MPDGIWLISEFAIPDSGWRRFHAQFWIWIMYCFFNLTTRLSVKSLPPIETFMTEAGMHRVEQEKRRNGLIVSETWLRDNSAEVLY